MTLIIIIMPLAFFIIICPDTAFAWGPVAHLEIGGNILKDLNLLAPHIRSLLSEYPYDFLYGNISADIVVGKNLVKELKHCHNWTVGFRLYKEAENNAQKAFSLGYLCHLASDTVAHNHYIPEMMIRYFSARTLRHIYWEMRYDALVDRKVWLASRQVAKEADPADDILLDRVIEEAPLSFRTNKTIFSSILNIHRLRQWHRMIGLLSSKSRWALSREDKERFLRHSIEDSLDVLQRHESAVCVKKDPTGRHNLSKAKQLRKRLKSMKGHASQIGHAMESALKAVGMD
jgi:hypothetical protein